MGWLLVNTPFREPCAGLDSKPFLNRPANERFKTYMSALIKLTRFSATIFLLLAGSVSAFGQKFGFNAGVKGGIPFTDFLESTGLIEGVQFTGVTRSSDFLIGPVVELTIPFGFAIELDGLYHQAEYTLNLPTPVDIKANAWELPYLAKFRFPIPLLKPFIEGGGAYRTFTDLSPGVSAAKNGVVLGGGIELKISKLRLSGEARYIHWGSPSSAAPLRNNQNQGEFLLGATF